ncbi:hypothetical protein [Fimbriiglobus ruber]|uniref:DUF5666 domain-containing protein n=1 Tax=Fimbriiglobus ruber TaxID=1908690 RepID=A0A225DKC0_9BACT|nr:hypothetical protein [Fimbriiglobus ruber]OWK37287.1 hypothetical protein FRUB_06407 [Fimbriiglobus ruber]OWK39038.1 hypothetical protein FRUB_06120 [Fimbriiglobus ruber]
MLTRLVLLVALTVLAATGFAQDPPAVKPKANFSASVAALNNLFKKNADGTLAKKYIGREFTITGTVNEVTEADGGQTLTLKGLPPTADDPSGCTIPFPAGHPSLKLVQGLTAGTLVRVRGTIDTVTGTAFTLKDPVLVSTTVTRSAKGPQAAPKVPAPGTAPKAEPTPAVHTLKPEDLKTTVVALTTRLWNDKTDKLYIAYHGQQVELTGQVYKVSRASDFVDGRCVLTLCGCPTGNSNVPYQLEMVFPAGSTDLPRLRNLIEGDKVTVRGEFGLAIGALARLQSPELVSGGEKPPAALKPTRTVSAEAFAKELLLDRDTAEKLQGQAITLTGVILDAGGAYSDCDLTLSAGKLKPSDPFGIFVACKVEEDQLQAVVQLPPGMKVRVVGMVGRTEKDRVWLSRCQVTLLEPNPMPSLTATELTVAYRNDPKAAAAKYGDTYAQKTLFLTGEVTALTQNSSGTKVASLKVPAGPKLELPMWGAGTSKIQVGQTVRFKAYCRGLSQDKTAVLVQGRPLQEAKPLPIDK